ncbi:MAG TPA: helix-turn-helix domain-containing protein, partial [Burkholderiaceae bacterium]
ADLSDLREETRATAEPELAIAAPEIAPTPPASLRESDQKLVERTVAECGGNVSRAARALGVSRGLVYRHLNRPRLARVEIATTGAQKTSNPAETGEASF